MADQFRKIYEKQKRSIKLGKINKNLSGPTRKPAGHWDVYFDLDPDPSHDWKVIFRNLASNPTVARSYDFKTVGDPGMGSDYLVAAVDDQNSGDMKALEAEAKHFVTQANAANKQAVEKRAELSAQQERASAARRQPFEEGVDQVTPRRFPIWAILIVVALVIGVLWLLV
jgi:hypothetical protein